MRRKLVSTSICRRPQQVVCCLLISLLIVLSMCQCTSISTQSGAQPPRAKIIYSAQSTGDNWQLHLTQWPNDSGHKLTPKVVRPYLLGMDVRTPRFSPDGGTIAFVGSRRSENGQETRATDPLANVGLDLWLLDIQTDTARLLTTDGAGYENLQWSPDGRYILAVSDNSYLPTHAVQEWKTTLYVWDVTSGKKRLLIKNVGTATWSPDSKYVYYDKTDETGFYYIPRNGGKSPRFLQPRREAILGNWSPDGKWFAYFDGGQLVVTDKSRKQSIDLGLQDNATALRWSPNSTKVALIRSQSKEPDAVALVVADSKHRSIRTLWSAKGTAEVTSWSHNGNWILVTHTKPESMFSQQLLAVPLSGGKAVPLVSPTTQTRGFGWREEP